MSALMNVTFILSVSGLSLLPCDQLLFSHAHNACEGQMQSNTIPNMLLSLSSRSSLSSLFHLKWEKEPDWRSHSRLWKYHLRATPPLPTPPFQSSCSFHKFRLEIYFFKAGSSKVHTTYFTFKS